jgi:hypothetical protein
LASQSARSKLRANLIEHECLGLLGSYLGYLEIQLTPVHEVRLRHPLRQLLKNFSVRSTESTIKKMFSDVHFWEKFRGIDADLGCDVLVKTLATYVDDMPRFKMASDTSSSANDSFLRDSNAVLCREFHTYFSDVGSSR